MSETILQAVQQHNQNNLPEAERLYRETLSESGDLELHAQAEHLLALVVGQQGRLEESENLYNAFFSKYPTHVLANYNQGTLYFDAKCYDKALFSFDRVLTLDPQHAGASYNRVITLMKLGGEHYRIHKNFQMALLFCEQVAVLQPDNIEALQIRLHAHMQLAQPRMAQPLCEELLRLQPENHWAHITMAEIFLGLENYKAGWPHYEHRFQVMLPDSLPPPQAKPLWDGLSSLAGRTLLLYREQGYGDTIMFCRFIKDCVAKGATVLLMVAQPLKELLQQSLGSEHIKILANEEPLPAFDCYGFLLSLPYLLHVDASDIHGQAYLHSQASHRNVWANRIAKTEHKKVGVFWHRPSLGHGNYQLDKRSIPLHTFQSLFETCHADVNFYSLQKDITLEERSTLQRYGVGLFDDCLLSFQDTAAFIDALDLVISIDTSVAHLAGAMGKPVWILLPFASDWRWLTARDDSPWYDSATLFRQPKQDDWNSVMSTVAQALHA